MAMQRIHYESSIISEKAYTSYKWSLNDWTLLFDEHYSKNVQSPKFLLSGTDGCTCQLTLIPSDETCGYILMKFSDDINPIIVIVIDVSVVNKRMEKKATLNSYCGKPVDKQITIEFDSVLGKTGLDCMPINNALILLLEFTIVKSVTESSLSTESYAENLSMHVRENLKEILDSQSLSDVFFVIGEKKLPAHKVILSANSEVFKDMFLMEEKNGSTIDIIDTEAFVFEELLNYMYSGQINDLEKMAHQLIVQAEKYKIRELKALCENYMSAHLENGNVIQYLIVAHKLSCNVLKTKALNFIKANTNVLANAEDYKILLEYPELITEIFGK